MGNLHVFDSGGGKIPEELCFQFSAVHEHEHGGILEHRLLYQTLSQRDHGVGLAGALRVPDEAVALLGIGGANQGALHGPHLVRAQNYFREFIVAAGEEDEVAHDAQKALRMNELLHQVFEIFAGGFFLPVEQVLLFQAPGRAVIEVDQVSQAEELHQGQQLGAFAVIAAHLIEGDRSAVNFCV